jgi:GTPase
MGELIDLKEIEEKVILIAVSTGDGDDTIASVDELEELVKTAGAVTVDKMIQNREKIHPGTYFGKGKIQEVKGQYQRGKDSGGACPVKIQGCPSGRP